MMDGWVGGWIGWMYVRTGIDVEHESITSIRFYDITRASFPEEYMSNR